MGTNCAFLYSPQVVSRQSVGTMALQPLVVVPYASWKYKICNLFELMLSFFSVSDAFSMFNDYQVWFLQASVLFDCMNIIRGKKSGTWTWKL